MGRTAEYVRCPSAAVHHISVHGDDRSTPLRMSIVDRTAHPPPEWWTDTTGHGRGIKEETWTARGSWYASNVA